MRRGAADRGRGYFGCLSGVRPGGSRIIGQAERSIKYRLTWDFHIEEARKKLALAEAAIEASRNSLADPVTKKRQESPLLAAWAKADMELDDAIARTPAPRDLILTPMRVETAFRGIGGFDTVFVYEMARPLEVGHRYLLRRYSSSPPASAEIVTVDRQIEDPDKITEDLAFLYSASATGTTVSGRLELQTPDSAVRRRSPLGGVKIRVSSPTLASDVTTNADGTFMISGVGPGELALEPVLPEQLMLVSSEVRRTIPEGGCIEWPLTAAWNGRVRGVIRSAGGTPLYGARVDLVPLDPAEAARRDSQIPVSTAKTGEFEFSAIPPGTYLLGVNLRSPPSNGAPYPPTYFPGTTNREEARPVVIGQGTQHDGLDFALNGPLARWNLELRIDTGSQPQSNVYACLSQAGRVIGRRAREGAEPLSLEVVEGQEYQVSIHADTPAGHVHAELSKFAAIIGRSAITFAQVPTAPHAGSPCEMR